MGLKLSVLWMEKLRKAEIKERGSMEIGISTANVTESPKVRGKWTIFQTYYSLLQRPLICTEVWKLGILWKVTSADWFLQRSEVTSLSAAVTKSSSFVVQVSERETASQSADSPVTDAAVSSSHNGPLTSGTSKPRHSASSSHVFVVHVVCISAVWYWQQSHCNKVQHVSDVLFFIKSHDKDVCSTAVVMHHVCHSALVYSKYQLLFCYWHVYVMFCNVISAF